MNIFNKTLNKENFLFGIFYIAMHGGILLLPNAIFWDDWLLFRTSPDIILDTFKQAGAMFNWVAYMHIYMLKIGPWIYKIATFFLMFISGILLNSILKNYVLLSKENRCLVVLLFFILPFNMARVALIDFPYTICMFAFFLAWHQMERNKILALILFFFSFNTNSLLVFYVLPMLDLLYRENGLSKPTATVSFAFRRLDFLLLPFLFFFIKINFFPPSGFYENYNQIYSIGNIAPTIISQLREFTTIQINFYLFIFFWPLAAFILKEKPDAPVSKFSSSAKVFSFGCLGLALAGIPYWVLGLTPTFNEWSSRHQLLFPLGSALVIIGLFQILNVRLKNITVAALLAASLSYGICSYYSFYVDWKKQTALVHFLSKDMLAQQSSLVLFNDHAKSLNAINRTYRFYEWNGILEQSTGNEKHFGIEVNELQKYYKGNLDKYFRAHYKAETHVRNNLSPVVVVDISLAEQKGDSFNFLNWSYPEFVFKTTSMNVKLASDN